MMTSKMVSLSEIIERVYRTTEFESIPWSDAAEDVLDVLRLIGVPQSYIDKVTNGQGDNPIPIIIENFRGTLPTDLAVPGACRLIQLDTDSNIISFKMMVESTDLFYQSPTVAEEYNTSVSDYAGTLTPTSLEMKLDTAQEYIDDGNLTDAEEELEGVIADIRQAEGRITPSAKRNLDFVPKYKLSTDYIFTNFKEGFVEMGYKAYPVDSFGMPMVPDNIKFIKAVEWYLISRIDYKRWRTTRNPADGKIWEVSDRESLWYIGAAKGAAHTPSLAMMESIKRMILRSIPKINEFTHAFKNTNTQERRKF